MCRTIDYKKITASLSHKVERLQQGGEMDGEGEEEEEGGNVLGGALERVRELELELAQTKLALVETECKNQDLTHQFTAANNQVTLHTRRVGCGQGAAAVSFYIITSHNCITSFLLFSNLCILQEIRSSGQQSNTWFTKTLSSIKEVAGAKTTNKTPESMKKSSSEQMIGSGGKPILSKPS